MTQSAPHPTRRLSSAIAGIVLIGALSVGAVAAQRAIVDRSPAVGSAQVVTQGIAEMPNREVVWRIVERTAPPRGEATSARRPLSFILASDEPVLLTNITSDGPEDVARLAPGEAFQAAAGIRQTRASLTDQPTSYIAMELVPAERGDEVGDDRLIFVSDAFTPPDGARDVDLVRNALSEDETGQLPDTGESVFILATDGAIDIYPDSASPIRLEAGEGVLVTGEVEIRATQSARTGGASTGLTGLTSALQDGDNATAGYVVIVIGVEIPPAPTATATPTETAIPPPIPTNTPFPTEPPVDTPIPTDTPLPTDTPIPDTDGDGLTDLDERQYNTDPTNPDSDKDGLTDGAEVFTHGSSPTSFDADDDGLSDGEEVNVHGTSPTTLDTDGDGYGDGTEIGEGWDPLDPKDPGPIIT